MRAIVTKKLRKNGITVLWHSNAPQMWSAELRVIANGLAQINPEIMKLDEWAKFRKDFELESYTTQDRVLYMHVLEDVTMFHTAMRARNGQGATFNVEKAIYKPPNTTTEQKNFVDGAYNQCDLVCSDLEVIALQNDVKLPLNNKLVFLEGDDHLKSRLAALGQVLPNYFPNRKKYDLVGKEEAGIQLQINKPILQLSRTHEEDRQHMTNVFLATQVDDTALEPSQEVRIPMSDKRKARADLKTKRRLRLQQKMASWQVNQQLAKETKVFNQVQPNPKYKPIMPENWITCSNDDIRAFAGYQALLKESKPYFEQVFVIVRSLIRL